MVILANIDSIPEAWTATTGEQGRRVLATTLWGTLRRVRECDVILINSDPALLLKLSAAFLLLPFLRRPIVAFDTVFRAPESLWSRLALPLKRFLLSRVDHFLHPFKDLAGYEKYFGIGPDRSEHVPFKPNLRYRCDTRPDPDGDYVLALGHSLRDFDTFFDAVERLPYPAAIARPDFAALQRHGSRFTRRLEDLPKQVRLLDHDPKSSASQVEVLLGARLVVVPLLKTCLVAAGTTLNAMLLGKCVIVSDGPASRGLFSGEVLTVPPEDPEALAGTIDRAWNDNELRERTAALGYRYALALGGEPELAQRLLDSTVAWCVRRGSIEPMVAAQTR